MAAQAPKAATCTHKWCCNFGCPTHKGDREAQKRNWLTSFSGKSCKATTQPDGTIKCVCPLVGCGKEFVQAADAPMYHGACSVKCTLSLKANKAAAAGGAGGGGAAAGGGGAAAAAGGNGR